MTLNLFGVDVYQTSIGGAPDVPIEYSWCIRYNYRTPWHEIDGEDMMDPILEVPSLEVTVDKELCELIVQAVGKLEPEDRAALVGHLYKLYSYQELERKNLNRQDRFYDAPYPGGPFYY